MSTGTVMFVHVLADADPARTARARVEATNILRREVSWVFFFVCSTKMF